MTWASWRKIHQLVDEGRITIDESKPRTLTVASSGDALETVRQRVCLEMADGGKIYMDCSMEKPRGPHCPLPPQRRMKEDARS